MKYLPADCCTANKELRYKTINSCSIATKECIPVYFDKLTSEVVFDTFELNLCEMVVELENIPIVVPPVGPGTPSLPLKDLEKLDPLTIDPQYTPRSFDRARIKVAEETGDWSLTDSYDRIGNKYGRWFLNGYNFTRYDLYDLNTSITE
ncbi:MAG: hypothetical protein ACC656_11130, partial [Candidatus Heimdallarchaeota archaeon]